MVEVVEGIIAYSRALGREARRLAELASDAVEREELLRLAEIHDHVPERPARSFREALTTVWICWIAIHVESANAAMSLGRLDQVLVEYYQRDIDSGTLSVGDAVELLSCLWLKIGDHVPTVPNSAEQLFGGTGSNQAITIGGVDAEGHDAVNDLTYVILRTVELLKLRDPNLNARYFPGVNPREYLRRLCEANVNTGATPALHNDRAVIAALTAHGDSLEQARDYGVVGCVEPVSNGRAYTSSGTLLVNLTSALELTLHNGEHRHTGRGRLISKRTGELESFRSFEELKQAFVAQADWLIEQATELNNVLGQTHQDVYPTPILSTLFEGPMDSGKDLVFGGAVINASGATNIGLADVVDSLAAIEQVVWRDQLMTLPEFIAVVDSDFANNDVLRQRLQNADRTPKYGNEHPAAQNIALWLVEVLNDLYARRPNYRGGKYRAGYWTMTNHAGFGRLMGATPNGRKARANFASGLTPVSGATPVLSAALNSISALPAQFLSNGVAVNLKYTPEQNTESMLDRFAATVEAYFDSHGDTRTGGMEIQFNVTTHDTFVDAAAHPENHQELLVRVSGYTAYFKDLNPQMQQEIIERTEYDLTSGRSVAFPAADVVRPEPR
jgi:formate C-acetyltransferase